MKYLHSREDVISHCKRFQQELKFEARTDAADVVGGLLRLLEASENPTRDHHFKRVDPVC